MNAMETEQNSQLLSGKKKIPIMISDNKIVMASMIP